MKINKTIFKKDLGKDLTFAQFSKFYGDKCKGHSIEEVYKQLGGKIAKPKPKIEDVRQDN